MPKKTFSSTKTKTSSEAPMRIKNLNRIKLSIQSIETMGKIKTVNYLSRIYDIVKTQASKLRLTGKMYPLNKLPQSSSTKMSGARINQVAQTMTKNSNLRAKSFKLKLLLYLIRKAYLKRLPQVSIRRSSKSTCYLVSRIP